MCAWNNFESFICSSSVVYRMNDDFHLVIHQQIETKGIVAMDTYTTDGTAFLTLVNGIDNYGDKSLGAEVYTWNPIDRIFVPTQTLFTDNVHNAHAFTSSNGLSE